MNPLNAVGLVFQLREGAPMAFLGSCFAYRHRTHFLTAAHVVRDKPVEKLVVLSPHEGVFCEIAAVQLHPSADAAVLVLKSQGREIVEPFWGCVGNYGLGEEYFAYGFPEDYRGPNEGRPTARLFRGHFQRFMQHESHMGYSYLAGELSTPCPGGLSGGPLFRPGAPVMITGLVAENIEAATFLDEEEIVLDDGKVVNEHYRRVINYGVAVMLYSIEEWINHYVPPRAQT
jgi:hypothetical protein